MPQSTVTITDDTQRGYYYNSMIKKIADFNRFVSNHKITSETEHVKRLIRDATSFRDMFAIKGSRFTLTRDDVDLLTRILNTDA